MHYDASKAPDPEAWLELDEQDRIDQVIDYHKRAKKPVGENNKLHAAAHVIVENQAAMGDATVVPATLDRHDAIHAIGSVLAGIFFDVAKNPGKQVDNNEQYRRELAELTAASWRTG